MTQLRWGQATDVGRRRSKNEDMVLSADPLFAVADGMGGHAGGAVASLTAVQALRDAFRRDATADGLEAAVAEANRAVYDKAASDPDLHHMGTTLSAVALVKEGGDDLFAVAHVGDSRVYLLRRGELSQLTDDHSVPQELYRAGHLSEEEAAADPRRNQVTRSIGIGPSVEADMQMLNPFVGDRLVLCSDGLFNEVDDDTLAGVLRKVDDPDEAARRLVDLANEAGGGDNISVVIVDVIDDGDRARKASAALASEPPAGRSGGATQVDTPVATSAVPAGAVATDSGVSESSRLPTLADRNAQLRDLASQDHDEAPLPSGWAEGDHHHEARIPTRRVTFRVVLFVLLLLLIGGGAAAAVGMYARGSYYVGLDEGQVTIFRGRPGGLLWFMPTVEERTDITQAEVPPAFRSDLEAGKQEPSAAQARRYVDNIRAAAPTTLPPVTVPPVTVPPVTVPPPVP